MLQNNKRTERRLETFRINHYEIVTVSWNGTYNIQEWLQK